MELTIKFKGKEITRKVYLKVEDHLVFGMVGTAGVKWDKRYYTLPYVKYANPKAVNWTRDQEFKQMVKAFIDEFIFVTSGKSPLAFGEGAKSAMAEAAQSYEVASVSGHTSGVPLWAKDEHKVWTECFKKDGSSYMRRTKFKKDSKGVIEKYLPHCSACPLRSTCNKPCANPEEKSQAVKQV